MKRTFFSCLFAAGLLHASPAFKEIVLVNDGGLPFAQTAVLTEAFCQELQRKYDAKPISQELLENLKEEISKQLIASGYPLSHVSIPEQEISDGVVNVEITCSLLGALNIENARYFRESRYRSYLHLEKGEVIDTGQLYKDLYWINTNPFRYASAVFSKGAAMNTTDVDIFICERRPLRTYYGLDDRGNEAIGIYRQFAGFHWGNFFGSDEQLSFQFTTTLDPKHLQGYVVDYKAPLPWRHKLSLYGGYAHLRTDKVFEAFKNKGFNVQGSLRYTIPFWPRLWICELSFGADFKRFNNTILYSELPIISNLANLTQGVVGLKVNKDFSDCNLIMDGEWFFSPGPIVGDQTAQDYSTLRQYTKPRFFYLRGGLDAHVRLLYKLTLHLNLQGQASNSNLLPSEQFGLGGMETVRGYRERVANGDSGVLVNLELITPDFSVRQSCTSFFGAAQSCDNIACVCNKNPYDRFALFLFLDYGWAYQHKQIAPTPQNEQLLSVGSGLRFFLDEYVQIRADWGYRLKKVTGEGDLGGRLHFITSVSY